MISSIRWTVSHVIIYTVKNFKSRVTNFFCYESSLYINSSLHFVSQNQKTERPQNREKMERGVSTKSSTQSQVWDCGSSLYDSFELNSFKRQLDSAMVTRTMSMPHLSSDHRFKYSLPPPPPVEKKPSSSSSKISRSIQKLLKSVFKSKQSSNLKFRDRSNDEYWILYDKTGALTTIPEVPEIDLGGLSPEINSLVRRTASDRISAASLAISCA